MKRTWTIIGVKDVPASFKWYQSLFGWPPPQMEPAHDYFGQILDFDGTVLLAFHQWGAHDHPSLMSPDAATPGNGLLLFFRVGDYDQCLERARTVVARFEEEPHVNPNTQTSEFSLRDPDGYYVTISALGVTDADEQRLILLIMQDLLATGVPDYAEVALMDAGRIRLFTEDLAYYEQCLVDEVQQGLHDSFIDTSWPACPHHPHHPLWYSDGWWRCPEAGAVVRLGELAKR